MTFKVSVEAVMHKEEIFIGNWVAFRKGQGFWIGRVLSFTYLTGKGKKKDFSALSAPVKAPENTARGLGVLCIWYACSENFLINVQNTIHRFENIENYLCTLPPRFP